MEIDIKVSEKPSLKIIYKDYESINTSDFVVEAAKSRGITEEKIKEQLSKLGDTQFSLNSLKVSLDENSFLPLSVLNELRRYGTEKLINHLQNKYSRKRFNDIDFKEKKARSIKH